MRILGIAFTLVLLMSLVGCTLSHRNKKIKELRPIWEQRGLFLFFLPPYSPQLNIAETLWRILKGKWIRPQDYITSDMLFYTTNRALADIGKGLRINFSKHVA